jgi:ABC-2 type transport system ATP-binding protein
MSVAETAIRVHGLEKSYARLHVLRGVDFDVARGSIFALLGSNGAGKTTVVRILSALLRADAGTGRRRWLRRRLPARQRAAGGHFPLDHQ